MSEKPCPMEAIGFVKDQVRAHIVKNPKYLSIDELIKDIGADIRVDVHRWDAVRKRYKPWKLHFQTLKPLDDLLTNGGRDLIHNAAFMTGSQPAALTYYAICNPGTFSPSASDTTLNTEITTPTGLARRICNQTVDGVTESFTHSAGQNTTVVVCGFKNNGGSTVTGIKGYGNFNAAASGTLGTESAFTSLDLSINDVLKLTTTLTLG